MEKVPSQTYIYHWQIKLLALIGEVYPPAGRHKLTSVLGSGISDRCMKDCMKDQMGKHCYRVENLSIV